MRVIITLYIAIYLSTLLCDIFIFEWMNEWMKWLLIYRLSSGQWPDLKSVHSTYHRLTDGLPTWVEQSKDTCSWSTSSFPIIIYSGSIISFLFLSFIFFFPLPTYIHLHLFGACWLSVCDWHSLNTNYYGTTFGGVPGSFNSVPDRMHVWPE